MLFIRLKNRILYKIFLRKSFFNANNSSVSDWHRDSSVANSLLVLSSLNHFFLVVLSLRSVYFSEKSLVNFSRIKLDSHAILLLQSPSDSHKMSEYSVGVHQAKFIC